MDGLGTSLAGSAPLQQQPRRSQSARRAGRLPRQRIEAVLAPLDVSGRTSVLTAPPTSSPAGQTSAKPLDGIQRLGRAFVGQVWDRLQQQQGGQLRQDAERIQQLEKATAERAVEVRLPRNFTAEVVTLMGRPQPNTELHRKKPLWGIRSA